MKLLAIAGLAAGACPLSAQDVRCLLVEDGPLPGLPGATVGNLKKTAVNQLGGYSCTLDALDAGQNVMWGHATGGPPDLLLTQGAYGPYVQVGFDNFFGIDDQGTIAYAARLIDTVTGAVNLDSVWLDDQVIAVQGQPIPSLPGKVWHQAWWVGKLGRTGITRDGQPFWSGEIEDSVTGASEGEGLFFGLAATPLYKTGDVPPGAPAAIDANGLDFDFAFSAYGTHHLTGVEMDVATTMDKVVVMDGAALFAGGAIVQEGQPIPASIGGSPARAGAPSTSTASTRRATGSSPATPAATPRPTSSC